MRSLLIRAALVLCAASLACDERSPSASSPAEDFAHSRGSSTDVLSFPGGQGNGPYALYICAVGQANAADPGTGTPNGDAYCGGALVGGGTTGDLTSLMAIPSAAFDGASSFPLSTSFVNSWVYGREVNLWDYDASQTGFIQNRGAFFTPGNSNTDVYMRPWTGLTTKDPAGFGLAFTGFLAIPASGSNTVKTIAVGSNDGAWLTIQGCGATCATTGTATISDLAANHAVQYSGTAVTFPASGGLFPFAVYLFNDGGRNGFELAWADGDQTGSLPSIDTSGTVTNSAGFTLVPATSIYAPDVHASLSIQPPGTAIAANTAYTFRTVISNQGPVPAYSLDGTAAGLTYSLGFPTTQIPAANITAMKINGTSLTVSAALGCVPTAATACVTDPGNGLAIITARFSSNAALDGTLQPSTQVTVDVTAKIKSGVAGGTAMKIQGVVRGHATDPSILLSASNPGAVVPAATLFVYTDDPNQVGTTDTGNALAMTGFTTESSKTGAVTFLSSTVANADSSPLVITIGQTTPGTPTINAFTADTVSTAVATTLSGTIPNGGSTTPLIITLSGPLDSNSCVSSGTPTALSWAIDARTGLCTCNTVAAAGSATSGNWICDPIALIDGSYTATASIGSPGGDKGAGVSYGFTAAPPLATITGPAGGSQQTHSATIATNSKTLAGGSTNVANATVVTVSASGGPQAVTPCSGGITSNGNFSCTLNFPVDGTYSVSATVTEKNGAQSPAGTPLSITVDTKPTISTTASNPTNNTTPTFSGTKRGDGTKVRVCLQSDTACATAICQNTGISATPGTAWNCTASSAQSGSQTYVAFEFQSTGSTTPWSNASATSIPLTYGSGVTLTSLPTNNQFNIATPSFNIGGACDNGESVSASTTISATTFSCGPVTCAGGNWSCTLTFTGALNNQTGKTLTVSETTADSSPALTSSQTIKVDLVAPANVSSQAVSPAVINTTSTNPSVTGAGENGATVNISASGTLRNGGGAIGPIACTGATFSTNNFTCAAGNWTGAGLVGGFFPEGHYTVTLSETDAAGNTQAGAAVTTTFDVKTTPATVSNVASNAVINHNTRNLVLNGTCLNSDSVTAAFTSGGSAWPPASPATCTTTCGATSAGAWSCEIDFADGLDSGAPTASNLVLTISSTSGGIAAPTSSKTNIVVDTTAPAAATLSGLPLTQQASGNPTIAGGGENGASVVVTATGTGRFNGDTISGTCNATVSGTSWSCASWTITDNGSPVGGGVFPEGAYSVSAVQTDVHGNVQTAAATPAAFYVKRTAPSIANVPGNKTYNTLSSSTFSGSNCGPGETVTVSFNGTGLSSANNTATCDGSGNWSTTIALPANLESLSGVTLTAVSSQTVNSFTSSSPTTTVTGVLVDTKPPALATVQVNGSSSALLGAAAANPPTINGTGENGAALALTLTGTPRNGSGTITATCTSSLTISGGNWSCTSWNITPTPAVSGKFDEGTYTLTVSETDVHGNPQSGTSTSATFQLKTSKPPAPAVTVVAVVGPGGPNPPAVTVSGEIGDVPTVTISGNGANVTCTGATVPSSGTVTCSTWTPATALAEFAGSYQVAATQKDQFNNTSNTSVSPGSFQVRSLNAPTLAGGPTTTDVKPALPVSGGASGQTVKLFEGGQAVCTFTLSASSGACPAANWTTALSVGHHTLTAQLIQDATHTSLPSAALSLDVLPLSPQLSVAATYGSNQPLITGNGASPGSTVTISSVQGGATLCTTTAASDGSFSCQVTGATLPEGAAAVSATATENGETSAAAPFSLPIDSAPTVEQPQSPTKNTEPQLCVALKANAPANTHVAVLEGGQTLCTAVAADGTTACCTPPAPLADGTHALTALATFPPGGTSASAGAVDLVIKTKAAAPTYLIAEGATVHNPLVLQGTAEANASVAVTLDGAALATVNADASGNWSAPAPSLPSGAHSSTAQATDALGNVSALTTRGFTIGLGGQIRGSTTGCSSGGQPAGWLAILLLGLVVPGLKRRSRALVALVAAVVGAGSAQAQSLNLDHFRPSTGGDGLLSVEGARPPAEGEGALQVRLWAEGQSRPLVFIPDGGGSPQALIRNRVGAWLTAQVYAGGPFSFAAQLPFLLGQHGDLSSLPSDVSGGNSLGTGLGDLRLAGRMGLLRQGPSAMDAALTVAVELPTGSKTGFIGDDSVQAEALFALGHRFEAGGWALDLIGNAFFKYRPSRDVLGIQEGSELGVRGGVAYLPEAQSRVVPARLLLELEGASFVRASFAGGSVPAEWHAGATWCLGRSVGIELGAGGGIAGGIGTPGIRMLGAMSFGHPACGSGLSTEPRIHRPTITQAAPPAPEKRPAPAAVQKPSPAEQAPQIAATDKNAPVVAPPPERKPAIIAAAPELPSLPDLPVPPAPAPAAREAKPAKAPPPELSAEPTLPDLPLPAIEEPKAKKSSKKERKLAMAPTLPDLPAPPGLDVPLTVAGVARLDGDRIVTRRPIGFREGSPKMTPDGHKVLDDVARLLNEHPEIASVVVEGHADSDEHAELAENRARAVVAYLRGRGVAGARLSAAGMGTQSPIAPGVTRAARRQNLRIELHVR